MLLLVGAGLLVRTFMNLRAVQPGFDMHNVLTARMSLLGDRYATAASVNRLYERGLERIRRIPGVQGTAVVNSVPMEFGLNLNVDFLETAEVERALTDWRYATAGYFETMKIPVVAGRTFAETDRAGAPKIAVVSEAFANKFYKDGGSPLGRRIRVFDAEDPMEIVGVVKDLREGGLTGRVPPVMYVPIAQAADAGVSASHTYFQVNWIVRAQGITPELAQRIREELRSIDPKQPITAFRSMDEIKARAMATERFQMTLLSMFAAIGLLLAAAGIYGLIAYSVAQRTREIGIRMALGAEAEQVRKMVVFQGMRLAVIGVAVGLVAAFALTRLMASFLFGVQARDPVVFVAMPVLLTVVSIVAVWLPARRASTVNPLIALRYE
jgi:putative ABC transport system permease protein